MALVKTEIESPDGVFKWFDLHSDTEGKGVLDPKTGIIYGSIAMREDDTTSYEEVDDPNWSPDQNQEPELKLEPEFESKQVKD